MTNNSIIEWPKTLTAHQAMCYESIEPLFEESRPGETSKYMAFAASCSKLGRDSSDSQACIHKIDVTMTPDFTTPKMKVTHEVLPGQGNCSQITSVNDNLRVAGFNSGAIIPIKNFGPKKTFNCDVRAGLTHHISPVTCLSSSPSGDMLASGSADGEIVIYSVREEEISFITRAQLSPTAIAGLTFFNPVTGLRFQQVNITVSPSDTLIAYATDNGYIGMVDARCKFGFGPRSRTFMVVEPRLEYSSICHLSGQAANFFYLGTRDGELVSVDFRYNRRFINRQKLAEDASIGKIIELQVEDDKFRKKSFIAYTNGTNQIKIIDAITWKPDERWTCDIEPEGVQKDLCQVGDRIITCGSKTSIGCWLWDSSKKSSVEV